LNSKDNQIIDTDFKALSGAAGSGGGVGYIPLKTGMYDFMLGYQFNSSNTSLTVSNQPLQALNNYIAMSFKLQESVTVNRVFIRVSGVSSPVLTLKGGIATFDDATGFPTQAANVITFVTNASATLTSFTAGSFLEFIFPADVTLSAGTRYFVACQVTAYTSGTINLNNILAQSWWAIARFPEGKARIGASGQTQTGGLMMAGVGYNDGSTTTIYFGDINDGSGNINIFPTSTTNTAVGARFALNLPVDEVYINKIALHQSGTNTGHSVRCKIFTDLAGSNAIGTSMTIANTSLVTVTSARTRMYHFVPAVKIKPYKNYYVMWEVTSGTATSTNPTFIARIGIDSDTLYPYDSENKIYYRANSADANFTSSPGFIAPMTVFYNTVEKTPRPHISSM